jgi:hypothetical protein
VVGGLWQHARWVVPLPRQSCCGQAQHARECLLRRIVQQQPRRAGMREAAGPIWACGLAGVLTPAGPCWTDGMRALPDSGASGIVDDPPHQRMILVRASDHKSMPVRTRSAIRGRWGRFIDEIRCICNWESSGHYGPQSVAGREG